MCTWSYVYSVQADKEPGTAPYDRLIEGRLEQLFSIHSDFQLAAEFKL